MQIVVEFTLEEAQAILDGLAYRSSDRVIMSAGAKLIVAMEEARQQAERRPTQEGD